MGESWINGIRDLWNDGESCDGIVRKSLERREYSRMVKYDANIDPEVFNYCDRVWEVVRRIRGERIIRKRDFPPVEQLGVLIGRDMYSI